MSETLEGSIIQAIVETIRATEPRATTLNEAGTLSFRKVRFEKWKAPSADELPACLVAPVETGDVEARVSLSEQYVDLTLQLRYSAELPDTDEYAETLNVLDAIATEALALIADNNHDYPWSEIQFGGMVWEDESSPDLATLVRTIHVLYLKPDPPVA